MTRYSKRTNRMDFLIDESRKTILIKQKWKYSWLNAPGTSTWLYLEKKDFHAEVDKLIWNSWGSFFKLKTTGTSTFANNHNLTRWNVDFDIEWVTSNEHWEVEVTKIPSKTFSGSKIIWSSRKIILDTEDTSQVKRNEGGVDYFQTPVVHEFGHAAGNSIVSIPGMHGDEYKVSSSFYHDKQSLMNIGSDLRIRHLDYILTQLNSMIPNTSFSKY